MLKILHVAVASVFLGCLSAKAQSPVVVDMGVEAATREFTVTIENKGTGKVRFSVYEGMPLNLQFELWSDERGMVARPQVIQHLIQQGAFVPLKEHILEPGQKLALRIKWSDLAAGRSANKEFLEEIFASDVHIKQRVSARAFIPIDLKNNYNPEVDEIRFESGVAPVFLKK